MKRDGARIRQGSGNAGGEPGPEGTHRGNPASYGTCARVGDLHDVANLNGTVRATAAEPRLG